MAIRDIVTRGFGNGTYSPGVNKIPTRGFTIANPPDSIFATNITITLPQAISVSISLPSAINVSLPDDD